MVPRYVIMAAVGCLAAYGERPADTYQSLQLCMSVFLFTCLFPTPHGFG
jgi:hypothetical protein